MTVTSYVPGTSSGAVRARIVSGDADVIVALAPAIQTKPSVGSPVPWMAITVPPPVGPDAGVTDWTRKGAGGGGGGAGAGGGGAGGGSAMSGSAGGAGAVLARFGGRSAAGHGETALRVLREAGLECEAVEHDAALWAAQRESQRGAVVLRVSATQDRLGALLATAREEGARLVARAAYGLAWLTLPVGEPAALAASVERLRAALAPAPCVLLDAPAALRAAVDPWGPVGRRQLELMHRVKERFDPARRCNPGLFVGGI